MAEEGWQFDELDETASVQEHQGTKPEKCTVIYEMHSEHYKICFKIDRKFQNDLTRM